TSLTEKLPPEIDSKEVAYDGLVVFVSFNYSNRKNSLPQSLNGRISFEQLRKLYFGKIHNWQQKPINASNVDVRLYAPDDNTAVEFFENKVLEAKGFFDKRQKTLTKQSNNFLSSPTPSFKPPTINKITSKYGGSSFARLLQTVYGEFEDYNLGAIAFGKLSQVFGQCSVYPLALANGNNKAIQPLIQDNRQPIQPTTDLCEDKGGYYPNTEVFKTGKYPLAYPIAIAYLKDNSLPPVGEKFADLLRTKEGQTLLKEIGLVPFYQIE
ncbi:MAG: substrate-binding domain-containing protein, partial [Cyanobacteria bacterium J06632_19]